MSAQHLIRCFPEMQEAGPALLPTLHDNWTFTPQPCWSVKTVTLTGYHLTDWEHGTHKRNGGGFLQFDQLNKTFIYYIRVNGIIQVDLLPNRT